MTDTIETGHRTFANGWTASVIVMAGVRDGAETFEVWAWHEDGRTDRDVQRWLAPSAVRVFLREVEDRP